MSFFLLSLLCTVIGLILYYLHNLYSYWKLRGIPYERPWPILGNLKGIGKSIHFRDLNQRYYEKFKHKSPIAGLFFMWQKAVFVMDLDLIKQILIKDFSNFHDRGIFHNVHDEPLTGHLLALEGEQWRALRAKLTPVFTSGKMKFMFPTIVDVANRLTDVCDHLLATEAKTGVLEMKELCARFTTDVIGTCVFGLECNSLKDPDAEFRNMGRSIFTNPRHNALGQAFLITNPALARKLHLKLIRDEVSEFFMNAVRNTINYRVKNNIKRNDFMDLMIELKAKGELAERKEATIDMAQGLTIDHIAAQAFVFFLAGFETSSTTMSFCLYELAMNQAVQDKLRTEIRSVLQKHNNEITYDAMNEMPYLEQVLNETLRKYPVLPHLIRKCLKDYPVPNTNFVIEKGLTIVIPSHAIQHDPEYFPDPEKFDPSRFDPENSKDRHPCMFMPFGDGPRNCIGNRFGKMQAKIGLINVLQHHKFSPSPMTEDPVEFDKNTFIISAKNGIYLHVERV